MPELSRKNDIILFLLFVATLHILLTYLVSHRVGRVMGTQSAALISSCWQKNEVSEKEFQDIPSKFAEKTKVGRSILFFLSLPFDPVFQPIKQQWAVRPFREGKIQAGEYKFRANIIGTATRVLNSLVFSLLIYWCFRIMIKGVKQHGRNKNTLP